MSLKEGAIGRAHERLEAIRVLQQDQPEQMLFDEPASAASFLSKVSSSSDFIRRCMELSLCTLVNGRPIVEVEALR